MSWWGQIWSRLGNGRKDTVARRGEAEAIGFLKSKGYQIHKQNHRIGRGEIDIVAIAPDGKTVVIVEVKAAMVGETLKGKRRLHRPEDHVTPAKQKQLARLAHYFIKAQKWTDRPVRFDVIGVDLSDQAPAEVRHHPGAFQSYF
jgi:putative endonuclease